MALRLLTLLYVFSGAANLSPLESATCHSAPVVSAGRQQSPPAQAPLDQGLTNQAILFRALPVSRPEDLLVGPDDRDPLEIMVDVEETCTEDDGETAAYCPEGPSIPGKGDLSPCFSSHLVLPSLLPAWRTPLRC
ncbi:hypothetical protein [Aquisphaera giovannonii]|uniref:hypothetical protein n=1 Tax=Aquisphaera giovannonii TaxID=406548 RepID=UPI0011E0003E|nr:hypothetical protein [Aquisphaera giovannonii]